MNKLIEHFTDYFWVYLVLVLGICSIIATTQEYAETKSEYLNLCVQLGKTQLECQMRWIEINQ
jgi:hypothetical protein